MRNSWITQDGEAAGFWNASLWGEAKKRGGKIIKRMIKNGLKDTSVTAVLIGTETWDRKWVRYGIIQSHERGNGLLGVYIHNIKDQNGHTDLKGNNPFDHIYIEKNGSRVSFSELYPTYDWTFNAGYKNFGDWVEQAAEAAGR